MTVCVAAMCGGNLILGAADRMLTSGDVEFEPETSKIYQVTTSMGLMIAGEASLQTDIYRRLLKFVTERIDANPKEWVPVADVAQEYLRIYQRIRSERAETRVLTPLGLTLDSFRSQQRSMLDSIASDLTKEIINFDMPSMEAIIAGIDGHGAHIYVVNNAEAACRDAIGFAAIGAGFWHANSQFMFAGHDRNKPLPETLLLTYAAKKRAEVAPGVGSGTDMFTMGPAPGTFAPIIPKIVGDIDKIYLRTRSRSARVVKSSNEEVTKYVDQLGSEAVEQQTATTPQPEPAAERKEASDGAPSAPAAGPA